MTYKKGWREAPDVPRLCPICDGKRWTPENVAIHNIKAAADGCRVYRGPRD